MSSRLNAAGDRADGEKADRRRVWERAGRRRSGKISTKEVSQIFQVGKIPVWKRNEEEVEALEEFF